jgi:multicomponent Na+:H+ antiporter subunit A
MTQLIIETLTVILFVLVFYHLPAFAMYSSVAVRARDLVIAIAVGTLMGLLALIAADQQAFAPISEYFQERSYEEAHGRNIVNVILVDFRGVDTLGEITVLATAAMGAFALLKLRLSKRARAEKPEAPAPGEGAET